MDIPQEASQVLLVPTRTVVESSTQRLSQTGYLLWARPAEGGEWHFVEGNEVRTAEQVAQVFVGFPLDAPMPEFRNELTRK